MGKTKLTGILLNLEPEKAEALSALASKTRIARSVLMREAIDDLLAKHKQKVPKRPAQK
jgi:predicted transcriptional regulator